MRLSPNLPLYIEEHGRALLARLRERSALILLTLLFLGFLALSLLVHLPALQAFDARATHALQSRRNSLFDALALLFSFLGNGGPMAVAGAILATLLLLSGRWRTALLCLLALLGHPLTLALKGIVGRERPEAGVVQVLLPAVGLSFPSGHALASTLFYGFLALLSWALLSRLAYRAAATISLALIVVCIGASRIYLGAHWLSDVIGGWTGGLFFLLLFNRLYQAIGKAEIAPLPAVRALSPSSRPKDPDCGRQAP